MAAVCAVLYRPCLAGNAVERGKFSSHGRETYSGRARGKHEAMSAGDFPPRGKSLVVIGDVPSPLPEHH
jgi:hypothetical protein